MTASQGSGKKRFTLAKLQSNSSVPVGENATALKKIIEQYEKKNVIITNDKAQITVDKKGDSDINNITGIKEKKEIDKNNIPRSFMEPANLQQLQWQQQMADYRRTLELQNETAQIQAKPTMSFDLPHLPQPQLQSLPSKPQLHNQNANLLQTQIQIMRQQEGKFCIVIISFAIID